MSTNIFKVDDFTPRKVREKKLGQKARVIWFTGLSGSGKTTLAKALEIALMNRGHLCYVLDGDNVRHGLNNNLGFSEGDRKENIRRIAEVSRLFVDAGIITINCFVSPTNELRDLAKQIIGNEDFIEVFVDCPLEICEARDVKGLYAKARRGEIPEFTGISAPFEIPDNPELRLNTAINSIEVCNAMLVDKILPLIGV